ncbi:MAG: LptF/LptG family permease [Ignavibacteriae bacterium]|nr:LptF/LptG family permease [Ignavibacteriota bacterium]
MWILWRHILRSHLVPFVFAFTVLMGIFLLQFIVKSLDQLAGKGLSAWVIIELTTLNLAWMVVLAAPMAVLVAAIMAFGTLSSTHEITAMRSNGVSLYRMMAPVVLASLALSYAVLWFNNEVLPDSNHRVRALINDINRKKPTLSLVPGLFSQALQGYSILVRKTFEYSNDLEGVTIFDYTKNDLHATVTAKRGTISFSSDYRKVIMDLYDGEIHEISTTNFSEYRKIRFEKHRIAMNAEGFDFQRSQENAFSRGDRELSASAMRHLVDSLQQLRTSAETRIAQFTASKNDTTKKIDSTVNLGIQNPNLLALTQASTLQSKIEQEKAFIDRLERQSREYLVEIHKKYAIPVACFVFVLIGVPLGIMARKGTFGMAASLSLGFFLLYWACLIGGEKLADRGAIDPWLGMWIANIIIGALGVYLTIRSARENLTINWSIFTRFIPKQWRMEEEPAQT